MTTESSPLRFHQGSEESITYGVGLQNHVGSELGFSPSAKMESALSGVVVW